MCGKTFVTMFPRCENVHLIKDVGMIPYILYKYYGYDSKIVGYNTDISDMPYLNDIVKGLKYEKMSSKHGYIWEGMKYLRKNAKNIDVLQLYHITSGENLRWILVYKFYNPKGKIYLKLDADYNIFKDFDYHSPKLKNVIKKKIASLCDVFSIETKELQSELQKRWGLKVHYITNGFFDNGEQKHIEFKEKNNIILTVGRLGTKQKNTEELLEAFSEISEEFPDWSLRLIGTVEEEFKSYIDEYFKKYPELSERVVFTGPISDRSVLENEYKNAKIFCMTSRWEGFAIVYVEALKNGCYIVSSNVNGISERTNQRKFGEIYDIEHKEQLIACLRNVMRNQTKMEELCLPAQEFAYSEYNWKTICGKLNQILEKA